jgi:5-methylthioribose kinase
MQQIDETNAEQYLRDIGRIGRGDRVRVRELTGGVSNVVLLVERIDSGPLFVLKQARPQLRVADPWFCGVERVLREVEVLQVCQRLLSSSVAKGIHAADYEVSLPEVLFCDAKNFLFGMTAAPRHEVWKQRLLSGQCDRWIAEASGRLLGRLHAATWHDPEVARQLADQQYFDQLRIDPYYRHVARHHPQLAAPIQQLIDSLAEHPCCLVHGDFSPKNLLVYDRGLMLVDCEVGHYGDPAFDIGFFLSHLLLKAYRAGPRFGEYVQLTIDFWEEYMKWVQPAVGANEYAGLVERAIGNAAGCCLARIEGKSKVDYLDEPTRRIVRTNAEILLANPSKTWSATVARLAESA